jgi:hypothetical protein
MLEQTKLVQLKRNQCNEKSWLVTAGLDFHQHGTGVLISLDWPSWSTHLNLQHNK